MNPWLIPWWGFLKGPLSGDVVQDMTTSWLSPQFEFNFAGNRRIETEVVADVASYGKQLGIISEAILELAQGKQGEAIKRLETVMADIEKVKKRHKEKLDQKIKAQLDQLKREDPKAMERLLKDY
ncbi:MAG: hypothetical protein HKN87_16480 [Saprospiraceae bacterium]|nr:hypothetical protein [Saprospiraceae bacterium]